MDAAGVIYMEDKVKESELIGKVHSAVYHQCQQRGYAAPAAVFLFRTVKKCRRFSVFIEVILIASSILQFFNGNPLDGTIYMLFGIGIAIYFIVIKENQKGGKDNGQ